MYVVILLWKTINNCDLFSAMDTHLTNTHLTYVIKLNWSFGWILDVPVSVNSAGQSTLTLPTLVFGYVCVCEESKSINQSISVVQSPPPLSINYVFDPYNWNIKTKTTGSFIGGLDIQFFGEVLSASVGQWSWIVVGVLKKLNIIDEAIYFRCFCYYKACKKCVSRPDT